MANRTTVAVILTAIIAVMAVGCSPNTGSRVTAGVISELRVASTPVSTLDYNKNNSGYGSGVGGLVMEPLLTRTKTGKLRPWLAESWSTPNPTTYVYTLRKGVTFTDGHELTAEEAAFSLNHYRSEGSTNAYNFPSTLKSIRATGRYTVTVTLTKPNAAWEGVLARSSLGIFSKSFYQKNKDTFGQPGTGVVGTGPWKLTDFNPTTGAELEANPRYWGEQVRIKKISFTFFDSETSQAFAFRAKAVDLAFPSDSRSFASTAGVKLSTAPGPGDQGQFGMNVLVAPWNDVHLRRAVAHALDKKALINAYGGYAEPAGTLLSPSLLKPLGTPRQVEDAIDSVPTHDYDLDKAKAEMAKSAYPRGVDVTIAVANYGQYASTVGQAVVAQLKKIGIRAKLKVNSPEMDIAEATNSDRKKIHSAFSILGAVSSDPGEAFNYALGSANATPGNFNSTNYGSTSSDRLIADAFATSDPAKRLTHYTELLKEYAAQVPFVPLFFLESTYALSTDFTWPAYTASWRNNGPWALDLRAA